MPEDDMNRLLLASAGAVVSLAGAACASPAPSAAHLLLPVEVYEQKVYASWVGQIAGNVYGLGYEFRFIDQPGPEAMPYGFAEPMLRRVAEVDGAFSDDDTDIEYMYLQQMERHGIEPTYRQLAEAWKHHVRERIWVANRVALCHMREGLDPPLTGMKEYNDQWFQIDPQLVNEIWAVTAPGMVDYAAGKSDWAARIVSDGFGVEPTVCYGAMYSAAFFESDVEKLVDSGVAALPAGSRFAETVGFVREQVKRHPDDWHAARAALAARYFGEFDYNRGAWPVTDANLNGACAIMALLYGKGDVQRTLDLCCGMGFDADNQAATMTGLLGIARGFDAIPESLLYPLADTSWALPFNDRYVNVTREDLPDASIRDMARRIALQGERVILAHGGSRVTVDGRDCYRIPRAAHFDPPFELSPPPLLRGATGEPMRYPFYTGRAPEAVTWSVEGALPEGVTLQAGQLTGTPGHAGVSHFIVRVAGDGQVLQVPVEVRVRGANLAAEAIEVLCNPDARDQDLSPLRDGDRRERTYFSIADHSRPKRDWYGYRWREPHRISALRYSVGRRQEWGGWFTSLGVEYLGPGGDWLPVRNLRIDPLPDFANNQWLKASRADYDLSFDAVEAAAIRMIGDAGGIEPDPANRHLGIHYYTAISELGVFRH
jgi:hypothetical protein